MPAMTSQDWASVFPEFRPAEFAYQGDLSAAQKIDRGAVLLLHRERVLAATKCVIHAAYAPNTGHSLRSFHYPHPPDGLASAIDRHYVGMPLKDQFLLALGFEWGGVGAYPYWDDPGVHTDTRLIQDGSPRTLWWQDQAGDYHYLHESPGTFMSDLESAIARAQSLKVKP